MVKYHTPYQEIWMWLLQLHFKQMFIAPVGAPNTHAYLFALIPLFCYGNEDRMKQSLKGTVYQDWLVWIRVLIVILQHIDLIVLLNKLLAFLLLWIWSCPLFKEIRRNIVLSNMGFPLAGPIVHAFTMIFKDDC